jgi:uncharacterized protein
MIVVLDTNVLVAGLLKPFGPSAAVLRLILTGTVSIAQDYRILAEYREVLSRPVFGFGHSSIDALLAQLEEEGISVTPPPASNSLPAPSDAPFWETALAANAEFLITGNKKHFPAVKSGPRILSPSEFLAAFRSDR